MQTPRFTLLPKNAALSFFLALYINIKHLAFVQKKKKHYFRNIIQIVFEN